MAQRIRVIDGSNKLGRHIEHDERSKEFPVARLTAGPHSAQFARHCPPYDQGNIFSCTGNAMAGVLMSDPFWVAGRALTEADAVRLYSEATHLDQIRGNYPPDDTGSTGLAAAKAAKKEGWITGYQHAFGLDHLTHGLSQRPGLLGINWYTSFDSPLTTGECPLNPGATVRGGHEVEMYRLDMEQKRVWCWQSWGATWGGLGNGSFWFSFATLTRLLSEQGDATFPAA